LVTSSTTSNCHRIDHEDHSVAVAGLAKLASVAVAIGLVDGCKTNEVALHSTSPHPEFLGNTDDGKQEFWGDDNACMCEAVSYLAIEVERQGIYLREAVCIQ
jgi:hypothetical protein